MTGPDASTPSPMARRKPDAGDAVDDSDLGHRFAISVLIPVFNKETFLRRCLQSVLAQTFQQFEAVIVDDGSTDGSLKEIESLVGSDARFRVITKANGGVSLARNTAARAARGEWLAFLDADDEWHPHHLASLMAMIAERPGVGLVASGYEIVTGTTIDFSTAGFLPNVPFDYSAVWERMGETPITSSSVALRRDVLKDIGGFPATTTMGEDVLTWLRAIQRSGGRFDPRVSATVHHDDAHSLTRRPSAKSVAGHAWFLNQLDGLYRDGACSRYLVRRFALVHCYLLIKTQNRADLFSFAVRRFRDLDLRTVAVVGLELFQLRNLLRRIFAASSKRPGSEVRSHKELS